MLRTSASLVLLVVSLATTASAQTLPAAARAYLGDWTIVDDGSGEAQAVVRIAQAGAGVEGRIIRILPTRQYPRPSFTCASCRGEFHNADLRQVRLVWDMRWNGERFDGGRIVDPQSARTYRASLALDGADRLRVRGYLGIRALGRTQVWTRVR